MVFGKKALRILARTVSMDGGPSRRDVRVTVFSCLLAASASACSGRGSLSGMTTDAAATSTGGAAPATGSGGAPGHGGSGQAGRAGNEPDAGQVDAGSGGSGADAGQQPDTGAMGTCVPLGPIPRRLWRLSTGQWGNAVQSLLGLPAAPVLQSTGGEPSFGLRDDASLGVDPSMLFDIYTLLDSATAQIDPTIATTIAPCASTTTDGQTTCATAFVKAFATLAYRRPVSADEVSDLMTVYQAGATTSYQAGIELVMKAVLASPSFLFRTELGPATLTADAQGKFPDTTLTPYEVAAQLSFTLLGNLPDAPLLAAAADGSLATPTVIREQIDRLLASPAAQAHLTDVVLDWLGVDLLPAKTKDLSLLTAVAAMPSSQDISAIEGDLWASARRFVGSILWTGSGKLDDLLTSQTVYLNGRLAKLYPDAMLGQAPPDDTAFVPGTWPATEGRSGFLTLPSYLWAASDPARASLVKRGKGIHDDVVCQDPVGAPIDLSEQGALNVLSCKSPDGTQKLSACDSEVLQSDARVAYQPCQGCHAQLDPYARVLQNFGPIGNYRTVDDAGRPIDPVATFVATQPPFPVMGVPNGVSVPGSPLAPRMVSGAQGLAAALLTTGVFDGCAAQRMLGAAIGSRIYRYDTCELGPIRAASDGTIRSLFINLLSPDFMRARAGGPQ